MDSPQICQLATLNRAFNAASSADFVWESKLPSNYHLILNKIFNHFPVGLGKRDIYVSLCRLNDLDKGTKKVWLDRGSGKLCLAISANKGLSITGVDDRRYWNHILTEESRFNTVAYLQHTWWFEVEGEVDFPFPAGTYSLFFRVHLGRAHKRFGRDFTVADGNSSTKVKFSMTQIDCTHTKGGICLDSAFIYPSEFKKSKAFLNCL
ncbi:unnamed protein product [Vicia faba]|uniref:Uncharacterized protein n=1 Tax=Vicia faba TaxID=3906 RepID=A0AAV0YZY2_VICFA|nr:unnamed protein product [Vicia faba]